ncbi:MAG: DUF445 domain-containing protein, partial [Persephonella sp.]
LLSVLIGGFIGYITNYLAIKMLFKPYKKIYLFNKIPLPFTPGVIPKERERIAEVIAETLEKYILPEEKLVEMLERSNYREKLKTRIEVVIDEIIENFAKDIKTNLKENLSLGKFSLKTAFILSTLDKVINKVVDKLKDRLKKKLIERASDIIEKNIEMEIKSLSSQLDIKKSVKETLLSIDIEELEYIILGISKEQLKHITYFGAILGGLIGLIQFLISIFI